MAFWNREEGTPPTPTAAPAATPPPQPAPPAAASTSGENIVGTVPAVRQSLGRETTVTGKLSFNAPTRIDGTLNGEVRATDLLIIGEEGFVDGAVRATQLLVLGQVRGEVHVDGRVEIAASGRVTGTVESQYLVVQAGGLLEGDCKIKGK